MRRVSVSIALAILVCVFAPVNKAGGQDAATRMVGTWRSLVVVEGLPQAVVTISRADLKFGGSLVFRGLTVNGQENVTLELPLADVTFDGAVLSFKVIFPAPEKTETDWELKLRGENEASFAVVKEDGNPVSDGPSFIMKRVGAK